MMRRIRVGLSNTGIIAVLVLNVLAAVGWILNIISLMSMELLPITGFVVLKIIGIFLFPIGAIVGWF